MGRVVKRFLLHNNRENEDVRESDLDELKQDVQMIRFEMLTSLQNNKENTLKYMTLLHNGISILGDYIFSSVEASEYADNFKSFQIYDSKCFYSEYRVIFIYISHNFKFVWKCNALRNKLQAPYSKKKGKIILSLDKI